MQALRGGHQRRSPQQLLLGMRHRCRSSCVGADHLDHGCILLRAMSPSDRRQRLHELVVALIAQQSDLELLDDDNSGSLAAAQGNPGGWLERNRRVVQRYQALVRSAATLDALVEQEANERANPSQL